MSCGKVGVCGPGGREGVCFCPLWDVRLLACEAAVDRGGGLSCWHTGSVDRGQKGSED